MGPTPDEASNESLEQIHLRETPQLRLRLLAPADRMKAFLEASPLGPPLEENFDRIALLQYFPNLIPSELLHVEVLDDIAAALRAGHEVPQRRIAKGRGPLPGRDGKVILLVKAAQPRGSVEAVDPWFFKAFDSVEAGTPVARVYLPHEGVPGLDCLGRPVAPPVPKPAPAAWGDTLEETPPGPGKPYISLAAKVSGYLAFEKQSLKMVHELVLSGNVDHHSGDIRFVGAVKVNGDVMKGFFVTAREELVVKGSVVHGRLTSEQGDVTIGGGVTGDPATYLAISERVPIGPGRGVSRVQIAAAGNIRANAVDGISAEAGGDIVILKEIRASVLHARGSVLIPGGHILGGEIHAVCGVEVKVLGTDGGVTTKIMLASDIESSAEYTALRTQLTAHESAMEMLKLYLGPYGEHPGRIGRLPAELRKRMENLQKKLLEVTRSRDALLVSQREMLATAHHNSVYRVNVLHIVYPGTVICAGEECMTIEEPITGKHSIDFHTAEKKFHVGELQPLECTIPPKGGSAHDTNT